MAMTACLRTQTASCPPATRRTSCPPRARRRCSFRYQTLSRTPAFQRLCILRVSLWGVHLRVCVWGLAECVGTPLSAAVCGKCRVCHAIGDLRSAAPCVGLLSLPCVFAGFCPVLQRVGTRRGWGGKLGSGRDFVCARLEGVACAGRCRGATGALNG